MSQKSQYGHQGTQMNLFSETTSEDTEEETQDPPATSPTHRVIMQGPPPVIRTRRISIQNPPSIIQTRRASIQDPPSMTHTRRVSIQDPPSIIHTRRASIQDSPSMTHTRRASIQDPPSIIHTRRASIQDSPSVTHTRRASIQDPPSMTHIRRVSIQDPPSMTHTRRASIQDPPSITDTRRASIQDPPSITDTRRASIQDTLPVTCGHRLNTQDVSPMLETHHSSVPSPLLITPVPLISMGSNEHTSQDSFQEQPPTTRSQQSDIQSPMSPGRAKVDVPPSITHSPEASIKSFDSSLWTFQDNFQEPLGGFQANRNIADDGLLTDTFEDASFGRLQDIHGRRPSSQLPIGWWLLNKTKKITRELSLVLTLACMVIIVLISTSQPWIHFQVPLTSPGDPAGNPTIPINTIFFVQCLDTTCMQEHDQNAYLLDFSWAFMLVASIASFCLCLVIIDSIFFTSSNPTMLDFTSVIISILAGTSMILSILFYLLQAHEYLQEGMTYKLGRSFYLAWTGVFFFLMIGLLSYLNYMNFWSFLAIQAIWT